MAGSSSDRPCSTGRSARSPAARGHDDRRHRGRPRDRRQSLRRPSAPGRFLARQSPARAWSPLIAEGALVTTGSTTGLALAGPHATVRVAFEGDWGSRGPLRRLSRPYRPPAPVAFSRRRAHIGASGGRRGGHTTKAACRICAGRRSAGLRSAKREARAAGGFRALYLGGGAAGSQMRHRGQSRPDGNDPRRNRITAPSPNCP